MSNLARYSILLAAAIVVLVIAAFFIGFLVRLAIVIALLSVAYYWFNRAMTLRRNRPGR